MNRKSMVVALGMMCGLMSLYGMDRKQAGYALIAQGESGGQEDGPRDTVIETRALEKLRASKTDAELYNAITNELRDAAHLEGNDAQDKVHTLIIHHNDHVQHMNYLGEDLYYGKTITTLPLLMRLFERTNKVRLVYDVLTGIVVVVNGLTLGVAIYDSSHASVTSQGSIVHAGQGVMFLLSVIPFGASMYYHYKQYWIMRPKQESVGY